MPADHATDKPCPDCPTCEDGYMVFNPETKTAEHTHRKGGPD
ncbi:MULTISPECIES: hypothetical protein [Streptomyces]|nr:MULTISPECIES: hypothetical protein [Streptomyces]GGT86861.1 hypothetical protein GCM10010272_34790 [Streptomyces lateritius]